MEQEKLRKSTETIFWMAVVLTLGMIFLPPYFIHGITPRELIKYNAGYNSH
jgi:hypothetical protein